MRREPAVFNQLSFLFGGTYPLIFVSSVCEAASAALSFSPLQPLLINQPVSQESWGAKCQVLAVLPSAQNSDPQTQRSPLDVFRGLDLFF